MKTEPTKTYKRWYDSFLKKYKYTLLFLFAVIPAAIIALRHNIPQHTYFILLHAVTMASFIALVIYVMATEIKTRQTAKRTYKEMQLGQIIKQQEVDQMVSVREIGLREQFLSLLIDIQNILLKNNDKNLLEKIVTKIGETSKIYSRVYVFKNLTLNGVLYTTQIHEYVKSGVQRFQGSELLTNINLDMFPYLKEKLTSDLPMSAFVSELPNPEKDMMEEQSIKSLVVIPIQVFEELWGFIGIDCCTHEHKWTDAEMSFLKNVAKAISLYKENYASEQIAHYNEEKFKDIAENISEMVFEVDSKMDITYINPYFETIFHYPPQFLFGKSIFNLMDHEDQTVKDEMARCRQYKQEKRKTSWKYRIHMIDKYKNTKLIEGSIRLMFNENGDFMKLLGTGKDVTEERRETEMLKNDALSSLLNVNKTLSMIGREDDTLEE